MSAVRDLQRLAEALRPVERGARGLAWNKERPWKPETHLWVERGLVVLDLHDLSVRLALDALDAVVEQAEALDGGAVALVTGRGRHSVDGRSRLRDAVGEALAEVAEQRGWAVRAPRAGRYVLVIDPDRAPRAATGALGPVFWLGVAVFVGLAVVAAPEVGVPLALAALVLWWLGRARPG